MPPLPYCRFGLGTWVGAGIGLGLALREGRVDPQNPRLIRLDKVERIREVSSQRFVRLYDNSRHK